MSNNTIKTSFNAAVANSERRIRKSSARAEKRQRSAFERILSEPISPITYLCDDLFITIPQRCRKEEEVAFWERLTEAGLLDGMEWKGNLRHLGVAACLYNRLFGEYLDAFARLSRNNKAIPLGTIKRFKSDFEHYLHNDIEIDNKYNSGSHSEISLVIDCIRKTFHSRA